MWSGGERGKRKDGDRDAEGVMARNQNNIFYTNKFTVSSGHVPQEDKWWKNGNNCKYYNELL